jgi:hypothetical protein
MYEPADESPRFCPNCGGAVVEGSRFCKHCGCELTPLDRLLASNAEQTAAKPNPPSPTPNHPVNRSHKILLLVGGGLLVVVALIGVVIAGSFLYSKLRNPSSQNIAASAPAIPTMGQKALQIEARILRGDALSNTDLTGLSASELRVLRNVHFARYGRKYDRPGLGDYFATRDWYKPNDSYTDSMLTATDKANVNLIVEVEKQVSTSSPSPEIANSSTPSNISTTSPNSPSGSLTNANVETATREMLNAFTLAGTVAVQGIQELPQHNSAVADLRFNGFEYAVTNEGHLLKARDFHPQQPRNRRPTDPLPSMQEMFPPRKISYSGGGRGILTRYNDGRWVLKEVDWGQGLDTLGVKGNVGIK